ncbi:MAG: hypothetical protein U0T36_07020 [Saprospiraceae bacterium]
MDYFTRKVTMVLLCWDGGDVSAHYETDHAFFTGLFGYTGEPLAFSNIGKFSEDPNDIYELNQGSNQVLNGLEEWEILIMKKSFYLLNFHEISLLFPIILASNGYPTKMRILM